MSRRLVVKLLVALVLLSGALSIETIPAMAYLGHNNLYKINTGGVTGISGIAFDASGDVYIAGGGERHAVLKFNPSGEPLDFSASAPYIDGSELTGTASEPFANGAGGLAVDDKNGDIYVTIGKAVDVFSGTGEYLFQITEAPATAPVSGPFEEPTGLAVDQATGDLYVDITGARVVDVFSSVGEYQSQISLGEYTSTGVAVDNATGRIYVTANEIGTEPSYILVYDALGVLQETWTGNSTPIGSLYYRYGGGYLAVDQTTGHVYYNQNSVEGYGGGTYEFSPTGEYVGEVSGEIQRLGFAEGVGVSPSGYLYIAGTANGGVTVFSPDVLLPDVASSPVSNITPTSARLNGSVGPDGLLITSCQFSYGLGTNYSESLSCSPSPGEGNTSVPVSVSLTGLVPNTTYQYRLVAENGNGANPTSNASFTTLPTQPVVEEEAASHIGQQEALLTATVNPEHSETSYRFVYGPTSDYGSSIPLADVGLGSEYRGVSAVASIASLQPGATYHFAVIATNQAGTVQGPDRTFTTGSPIIPGAVTGAASVASANEASVSGTVDPKGAATTYEFDLGTDTAYGSRVFGSTQSGSGPETVTAGFRGLAPSTIYHYRLVASNAYGTTYGADATFATPGVPSAVLDAPEALGLVPVPQLIFPAAESTKKATVKAKKKLKVKAKKKRKKLNKSKKSSILSGGRAHNGTRGRS